MDTIDKVACWAIGILAFCGLLIVLCGIVYLGWSGYMEYKAYKSQPDVYIQKYTHTESKKIDLQLEKEVLK